MPVTPRYQRGACVPMLNVVIVFDELRFVNNSCFFCHISCARFKFVLRTSKIILGQQIIRSGSSKSTLLTSFFHIGFKLAFLPAIFLIHVH